MADGKDYAAAARSERRLTRTALNNLALGQVQLALAALPSSSAPLALPEAALRSPDAPTFSHLRHALLGATGREEGGGGGAMAMLLELGDARAMSGVLKAEVLAFLRAHRVGGDEVELSHHAVAAVRCGRGARVG